MFKVNDYVTRISYNNDIVFQIKYIYNNYAILQGKDVRLCADCYISDLKKQKR